MNPLNQSDTKFDERNDFFSLSDGTTHNTQTFYEFKEVNYSQLQDLRYEAYCNLALWGHPAWIQPYPYSMSTTAAKQWVAHHRTWVAAEKITVAEIIGGVRGVIPQSRLAKYGDYRYDIDSEDMYIRSDGNEDAGQQTEKCSKKQSISEEFGNYLGVTADEFYSVDQLYQRFARKTMTQPQKEVLNKPLDEWLKKIRDILMAVKAIANYYNVFHARTDALIKICLKIISDVKYNRDILNLMETDVAFYVAYEELLREHVNKIELHSIPQPPLKQRMYALDLKREHDYWLKLSSMDIRRLWKENTRAVYPHELEYNFLNEQYHLIWINFLRRQRKSYSFEVLDIDIPKSKGSELLGTLLQTIENSTEAITQTLTKEAEGPTQNNSFPEAHGEWTKNLFPHREGNKPPTEKSTMEETKLGPSVPSPSIPNKPDSINPTNIRMPLRFFMTVPPPPITFARGIHPIRPPYVHCQRRMPNPPRNNVLNCRSQQRQFIVPRVSVGYLSPTANSPVRAPPLSWKYVLSQRRGTLQPIQHQHRLRLSYPRTTKDQSLEETAQTETTDLVRHIPLPTAAKQIQQIEMKEENRRVKKTDEDYSQSSNKASVHDGSVATVNTNSYFPTMLVPQDMQLNSQLLGRQFNVLRTQTLQPRRNFQNALLSNYFGSVVLNGQKHQRGNVHLMYKVDGIPRFSNIIEHTPTRVVDPWINNEDKVKKWLDSNKQYMNSNPDSDLERISASQTFSKSTDNECGNSCKSTIFKVHKQRTTDYLKFKHLVLSYCSLKTLKKGDKLEHKIKFLKKFFAEAEFNETNLKFRKHALNKLFLRNRFSSVFSKTETSPKERGLNRFKRFTQSTDYDKKEIPNLSAKCLSYKTLMLENFEYNTFPSKRIKQCNVMNDYIKEDYSPIKKMNKMVSDLDYYNVLVNTVIFAKDPANFKNFKRNRIANGWGSFELTVKSVLQHITILIKNQHAQDIKLKLIKL